MEGYENDNLSKEDNPKRLLYGAVRFKQLVWLDPSLWRQRGLFTGGNVVTRGGRAMCCMRLVGREQPYSR